MVDGKKFARSVIKILSRPFLLHGSAIFAYQVFVPFMFLKIAFLSLMFQTLAPFFLVQIKYIAHFDSIPLVLLSNWEALTLCN